ncbi:MAG: sigma-70 family RNA polymerase sigma factor [Myxococcales bacterium]|nr:sigma-70 family RNA polymerase sigma factor [Myxococcales bacterium]
MAPPTHAEMMPATRLDPDPAPGPPVLSVAELYDLHAAMVFRSLRALGVHEANLDDAVQDVFLVVHRRLADFEGRSAITTWLYGIARRVAADYRRRRPLGTGPLATVVEVADRGPAPSETLARREAARTVMEILEAMEPDKREVFALMELEQLSAPVVAEMIGVPLNTVYSRLRLARARFEQALARLAATELREVTP